MSRRLRDAVEIVSDIGSLAFDLQHHSDVEIAEAVTFLRQVNPEMFSWLVQALERATNAEIAVRSPSERGTADLRAGQSDALSDPTPAAGASGIPPPPPDGEK